MTSKKTRVSALHILEERVLTLTFPFRGFRPHVTSAIERKACERWWWWGWSDIRHEVLGVLLLYEYHYPFKPQIRRRLERAGPSSVGESRCRSVFRTAGQVAPCSRPEVKHSGNRASKCREGEKPSYILFMCFLSTYTLLLSPHTHARTGTNTYKHKHTRQSSLGPPITWNTHTDAQTHASIHFKWHIQRCVCMCVCVYLLLCSSDKYPHE